jgi:hypothetical protein
LHATDALSISGHTITLKRGNNVTETVTVPDNNTTYSVGDGGLSEINFTSADHSKLNGIEASANNYSPPQAIATSSNVTFNTVTASISGDVTGAVTGAVTGDVTGDLTGNVTGDVTGNADTASTLTTARTIGGVSFNGSTNINLPGVNATGNQDTTGTSFKSSKLETARTISGVSFDGTSNISLDNVYNRRVQNSITASTASTAIDFNSASNFYLNLSSNTTFSLSNTANNIGLSGMIILKQDATGGRSFTLPSSMKTPLGGAAIDQETSASNTAILSYYIAASDTILVNYIGDFA